MKTVVVPITPPLAGYDDVKPRLLEMKAKAQEGLGMVSSPYHVITLTPYAEIRLKRHKYIRLLCPREQRSQVP